MSCRLLCHHFALIGKLSKIVNEYTHCTDYRPHKAEDIEQTRTFLYFISSSYGATDKLKIKYQFSIYSHGTDKNTLALAQQLLGVSLVSHDLSLISCCLFCYCFQNFIIPTKASPCSSSIRFGTSSGFTSNLDITDSVYHCEQSIFRRIN